MEACCLSFFTPLPANMAAPPWETWRMTGDLESRAPSRAATAVDDEVTFYGLRTQGQHISYISQGALSE